METVASRCWSARAPQEWSGLKKLSSKEVCATAAKSRGATGMACRGGVRMTLREWMPGGVKSPVRSFRSVGGNPIVFHRANGCRCYEGSGSESEPSPQGEKKPPSPVDPETGIDADGYVTSSLPKEFLELMKEEREPPNSGLIAFGVVVVLLARGIIWREIQNWINLAILAIVVAAESVQALGYKTLEWGGQPVEAILEVLWISVQTVMNFFRFAGEAIWVRPLALALLLSTIVLLVGESVSKTFQDAPNFPSRNMVDFAGLLGLAAALGLISAEFMLLALLGLTSYLLGAKKYNPVAGLAPAVATIVAVAGPAIRWPVFGAFVGVSVFRCWREGYLSQGAVMNTRYLRREYPRVLVGLVFLLGISMVSKVVFAFEAFFLTSPPPLDE